MTAAKPLDEILEKELQSQVFDLARLLGWKRGYHTFDSRRSASGFPDIVLVRDRVVYLELKREKTKCTPAQREWLAALRDACAEVYVIRPRNLDHLAQVLAARASSVDIDHVNYELRKELEKEVAAA